MFYFTKIFKKSFSENIISSSKKASIYIAKSNDIIFNLSTEEYLYEHEAKLDKPILFLYQNDKNVVIGKHQNPFKECNIGLMEKENVDLASK
jgi:lipoate-protein ligase A